MPFSFGSENRALTKAIRRVATGDTKSVAFTPHSEDEMENDGFDHDDVLTCLRKGTAYGPEIQNNQLRANVVHQGLHIRVVAGGLDHVGDDWSALEKVKVITVMRTK